MAAVLELDPAGVRGVTFHNSDDDAVCVTLTAAGFDALVASGRAEETAAIHGNLIGGPGGWSGSCRLRGVLVVAEYDDMPAWRANTTAFLAKAQGGGDA